ncbi:PAS domain-containing sensor histidine kinase [Flavobacterium antarcticum]|uniref:PAS domain-containing sensor histidine kinase n=1 Tax=Flavobacterium antarcticum TaxID=271155 RepID=UPI0003B41B74|nr:PAS domain-containing sensor histidine kinase [Flavobacterium antarcticum]
MTEENNTIFKRFFDISPDLLCIAGFDGYFKKVNNSVSELLGFTEEELLSKPINEFIYPDDRDTTANVRKHLTKNSTLQNFENRYVTKSGEIVWLAWTSMPVSEEELVFAIAKNITHKKILEEERNSLLTTITRINSDLKQLTYTSSHDLRSPVNNLISIFSLLDVSKIDDSETLEFIKMLETTSGNLKETLNEYLDLFIQRDNLNAELEPVNLNKALNSVLLSINSLVKSSGTSVTTNFSAFENISFNKSNLESVLLNLTTNAIKYAKPNIKPKISITSKIHNGTYQLIFADNGLGFNMEVVKDKIFGLHQKFHNHVDSRGIGLYLVHNHITSLGGQITVESEVNVGTQFTISFKS